MSGNSKSEELEQMKLEEKKKEEQAKEYYGTANYFFIKMDQPRGWKGFVAKGVMNGLITAGCIKAVDAVSNHFSARKNGRILTLENTNKKAR